MYHVRLRTTLHLLPALKAAERVMRLMKGLFTIFFSAHKRGMRVDFIDLRVGDEFEGH